MKHKDNINRKVDETLNSLDGLEKAKTDHFYFTRLQEKIKNKKSIDKEIRLNHNKQWQLSLAAVFLLIIINVAALMKISNDGSTDSQAESIEYFADDYDLQVETFYDTEFN